MSDARDKVLKEIYLNGGSRQEAMRATGIINTNAMSSASNRLGLRWSWQLQNRKSGVEPKKSRATHKSPMQLETPTKKPQLKHFENRPLPTVDKQKLIDAVQPSKALGPVSPLHLSSAFPTPLESGLTERELFWIAQLYVRDFGPPDYA